MSKMFISKNFCCKKSSWLWEPWWPLWQPVSWSLIMTKMFMMICCVLQALGRRSSCDHYDSMCHGFEEVVLIFYTVCKIDLILRSIQRRPQMQFSMARKFKLQLLRRYSVKFSKMRNFTLGSVWLGKLKNTGGRRTTTPGSAAQDSTPSPLLLARICQCF